MVINKIYVFLAFFIFLLCPIAKGQNGIDIPKNVPQNDQGLTPSVNLIFSEEIAIARSRVFLSDIARCSGNELLCQESYGIEILKISPKNPIITINERKIREILENEWPLTSVKISGSRQIKIKWVEPETDWNTITEKLLVRLEPIKKLGFVLDAKITKLSIPDDTLRFEPIGFNPLDLESPQWVIQHLNGKKNIKWAAYAPESEEPLETFDSEVNFDLKKLLVVSKRDIFRGDEIRSSELELIYHKLEQSWNPLDFEDAEDMRKKLIGRIAKQDIKAGIPIFMRYTDKRIAVKRNQIISVTVGSNSLAIGFQGKALSDGSIGDFIEVLYPNSKRTIKVQITDSNSASLVKMRSISIDDYSAELTELE
jgi:flagella basal body P-ring formation protein FlgA